MTTFLVAYKNDYTTEYANKTGDAKDGWQRISGFVSFSEAKDIFNLRKNELTNSAVAIFAVHEKSDTPWFCRRPRFIANRHIIGMSTSITPALGGLINSLQSDWF